MREGEAVNQLSASREARGRAAVGRRPWRRREEGACFPLRPSTHACDSYDRRDPRALGSAAEVEETLGGDVEESEGIAGTEEVWEHAAWQDREVIEWALMKEERRRWVNVTRGGEPAVARVEARMTKCPSWGDNMSSSPPRGKGARSRGTT
ncbi:hypothetical protein ZWY2020_021018 [Hordeum vulgare]|nr:hypothetical protein ZWY2020_021018 [Hordeum vulgare]